MGGHTNCEDDREKSLPSAFLALLWLLPPPPRLSRRRRRRRAAQEKISGDQVSISPHLRWTLLALRDLLWEQNLLRLSRLVLAARRLSSPSRLEGLRGGVGGGQIRNLRNAPPWIRSRRRWARACKVTGVFCTSLVGSMRTGRRTTIPPPRTW